MLSNKETDRILSHLPLDLWYRFIIHTGRYEAVHFDVSNGFRESYAV